MAKKSKNSPDSLDRTFHVMRFTAEDKAAIKEHFSLFSSRHEALMALVPVLEEMKGSKPDKPDRHAMRLGLPTEFIKAAKKLKRPMTESLVLAAKRYSAKKKK